MILPITVLLQESFVLLVHLNIVETRSVISHPEAGFPRLPRMMSKKQWPTAAVLTVLLSLFAAQTTAAGIIQKRALVHEWISIDSGGTPITHTPEVKTKNGAVSTVVSVPYILTGTVYTVSGSAGLSTVTGSPAPPAATNTNGAGGQFPVCDGKWGVSGPFCQPFAGSRLSVGTTYLGM